MKRVIGFMDEFVQPILDGVKLSTMRGPWIRPAERGLQLMMYTGFRTTRSAQFAERTVTMVKPALVHPNFIRIGGLMLHEVWSNRKSPDVRSANPCPGIYVLAMMEGFNNPGELHEFFSNKYGLPWTGQWIYWGSGDPFA